MNLRLTTLTLLVALTGGCTCSTGGDPDASVNTDGGLDGGGEVPGAHRVNGVTPGAAYSGAEALAPGIEVTSSESRLYLVQTDGGLTVIDRPAHSGARYVTSLSKDRAYLYSRAPWQGIWRVSDGAQVVRDNGISDMVIGETAAGALVTASDAWHPNPELVLVPLDGSTRRVIGSSTFQNAALFPDDLVFFGNEQGLWRADLKTTAPATLIDSLDSNFADEVKRIEGTPFGSIRLRVGTLVWLDATNPSSPVVTDLEPTQYGFVSATGTASFVRLSGTLRDLMVKTSIAGPETSIYTAAGDLNTFTVYPESGVIVFAETLSNGPQYYIAELKVPFEPISIPAEMVRAQPLPGTRRAYVLGGYGVGGAREIDFATRTASAKIDTLELAVRGQSLLFIDPVSKKLRIKPFGLPSAEVSSQRCWLLPGSSELGLHQCADRALYRVDSSDRQARVAGLEASDDGYAFATSGDLVRYFDPFGGGGGGGGSAWLYQLSTKTLLLSEIESHFYNYRFGAGKFVRGVGEDSITKVFDAVTGADTLLEPEGPVSISLFPSPAHRDGGAHIVYILETDAGSELRLYDFAAGQRVPIADAGDYRYRSNMTSDRFVATVMDRDNNSYLLEGATGRTLPFPRASDGGLDLYLSDVVSAAGQTRYIGGLAIYDENLTSLVEFEGYKRVVVDSTAGALYALTTTYDTTSATQATNVVTVFDDGRSPQVRPYVSTGSVWQVVAQTEEPIFMIGAEHPDAGFSYSTYTPRTDAQTQRYESRSSTFEAYGGGFVTLTEVAGGASLIAFPNSDAAAHTLTQPSERVLRHQVDAANNRLIVRSTTGTWHEVTLSVFDLNTLERQVIYRSDANTKLGAFTLSADGSQVLFTTSDWQGTTSSLWVKPL